MLAYLARRILTLFPLLLGITVMCFALIHLTPGDPTQLMAEMDPRMKANAAMAEHYGSNRPAYLQYIDWVTNLAQGNLGTSLAPDGRLVADKMADALPITVWLNVVGLVLVLLLSIPLGMFMATRPFGVTDTTLTLLLYLGTAAPGFWLALLGMQWLGVQWGWVPLSGMSSFGAENLPWHARMLDMLWHLSLPLLVGTIGGLAGIARFIRGNMLATLRQDYILTARAKGATPARTLTRHGLRNALLPVITILGLSVPGLIGGSVIMESIFALPGMGQLFYTSVMMRDYPTIMGILVIGAALTLVGNLLADIAYAYADPRIRLK